MKKIIAIFLILISINAYDLKKADFATFCNYVSYHINKNIIISEEVNTNFSVFMPTNNMTIPEIEEAFFTILKAKKLDYKIINNTILIYKKSSTPLEYKNYIIRFHFIPKQEIINLVQNFFPNRKFQIFQNRIFISLTKEQYNKLKSAIYSLQKSYLSAQLNFVISVINNKKLKQFGVDLKSKFKSSSVLLALSSPTFTLTDATDYDFSSVINFLVSNNIAKTLSKPVVNLVDSFDYTLESVHSIPYITKTITYDKDNNPVVQTDLNYKDIGLKIYIKNVYITKRNIDFDLDIYVENIISIQDNTPITDTKHFNTHIQLTKKHNSYLIAGLKSYTLLEQNNNVPVLSKLPIIGYLFKKEDKNVEDLSFTLFISTDFFKAHRPLRSAAQASTASGG